MRPRELWWLWVAIALPSWPIVHKFTGVAGVAIYSGFVALALWLSPIFVARVRSWSRRSIATLAAALFGAIVLLFAIGYPRANVHEPGRGSDDDDAHDAGVAALVSGESPYARRTYLDNELHQLPGSYLLAAPFAMAGASALQNLMCLPLFFVLVATYLRDPRTAVAIAGLILLLSAAVSHAIVTGSSYHWNAIWVLLGIWLIVRWPRSVWAAVFCGIAMCSRPNFMLLALPMAGFLWRTYGRAVTIRALGIVALTIAVLVVPLIVDPAPFSPINGFGRLEQLDDVARGAGITILVLTVIVAVMATRGVNDERALFQSSAMIQLTPVVAGMIVGAWIDAATSLSFASYASFASWFLLIANAAGVERDRSADAPGADESV